MHVHSRPRAQCHPHSVRRVEQQSLDTTSHDMFAYYAPAAGISDTAIRRLSVPALGAQLPQATDTLATCGLAMCGRRTRPRTDVDQQRVELPSPGGISSRRPRGDNLFTSYRTHLNELTKLDARQSRTSAHPAAPLAACVQRHTHFLAYANASYRMSPKISRLIKSTQTVCHSNAPRGIENLISA